MAILLGKKTSSYKFKGCSYSFEHTHRHPSKTISTLHFIPTTNTNTTSETVLYTSVINKGVSFLYKEASNAIIQVHLTPNRL